MYVINLIGGPGCGKSTIASFLFSRLKGLNKYNVELVEEYAKNCVYEGRTNVLKEDQLYVFAKQNHKLVTLQNYTPEIDMVVIDSPLILSNIYGTINESISDTFKTYVSQVFNSYKNINFLIKRGEALKYQQAGRIQTEEEAKQIDKKIEAYLKENNIKYQPLVCNNLNYVFEQLLHSSQFSQAFNK